MIRFSKKVEEKAQAQGWDIDEILELLDYGDFQELQDTEAIDIDENYIYFASTYDIMKLSSDGELTVIEDDGIYFEDGYIKDSEGNIICKYL